MIFVHEKCLITILNSRVEFYKILEIGLTGFGSFIKKVTKELRFQKRKKRKKKEKQTEQPSPAQPAWPN
jgi:hypothetical protein